MSKDKKKKDLSSEKALEKEFGKIISNGHELINRKKDYKTLPVSPALDLALNGGLLEGTWTVVSGAAKVGKTSSILQICKNAQDEDRPVIYIDVESRLKTYNLEGVHGLDLDKIQIVHGPEDEEDPLAAEDFLKICESLIKMPKNKGAVCVLDSTSSLVPRNELEEDPSATLRASLPKLLTHWIKKNAQVVVRNKIIFIAITHYITNTSGYGKTRVADCGVQLQYQADTKLDVIRSEDWLDGGDSGKKIGQKIHWKIACSSLGASGTECIGYFRFNKGLDKTQEILEIAIALGVIEQGGSWFTLNKEDAPLKIQGKHNMYEHLESNVEDFNLVCQLVKDMLE